MCHRFYLKCLWVNLFLTYFPLGSGLHVYDSKGSQNIFNFHTSHDQDILQRHKRGLYGAEKSFFVKAFQALDSFQGRVGKPNGYELQFKRLSAGAKEIDWGLISGLGAKGYKDAIDKVSTHLNTALRFGSPQTRKLAEDAAKLIPAVVQHRDDQLAPYIATGTQDPSHVFIRNHWNKKWAYFQIAAGLSPSLPPILGPEENSSTATGRNRNRGRG